MKTITEDILVEEIETLLNGGTIDFFESEEHNLKLKISGKNIKGWKQ